MASLTTVQPSVDLNDPATWPENNRDLSTVIESSTKEYINTALGRVRVGVTEVQNAPPSVLIPAGAALAVGFLVSREAGTFFGLVGAAVAYFGLQKLTEN